MGMLLNQKRSWVHGLLTQCPTGNPDQMCPVRMMRKLPLIQRLELIDSMSEPELDDILHKHQCCIAQQTQLSMRTHAMAPLPAL